MKRRSIFLSFLLNSVFILLITAETIFASGTLISAVSRLDLSSGFIEGENAGYSLVLPQHWQGYLVADREQCNAESKILDKLSFYYQPFNKVAKPVLVISLSVYNKNEYIEEPAYRKLMETNKYVFSVKSAIQNYFAGETDKAIFNIFLRDAGNDDFLVKLVKLQDGDERVVEHTISVNGKVLSGTVIRDHAAPYLPVREVCQALEYKVGWLNKEKAVTISKGRDYYALLTLNETSANMGYSILMQDGTAYVSSIFFIQQLKCNVEVDNKYNVSIYK